MNANLYDLLSHRFPEDGAALCIETPLGPSFSYEALERESARYANALRVLGVEQGDRVAAQVEKSPQALFLYLACLRGGYVYLPVNPAYLVHELDHFLADAEPRVVVVRPDTAVAVMELAAHRRIRQVLTLDDNGEGSLADLAAAASDTFDNAHCTETDIAALLYTSGTTGKPKGAMLSCGNLASNTLALHRIWGFEPGDVLLHALPLFHTHGLFVAAHCALLNGSPMIYLRRFDAEHVHALLPRATVFMGVPTFYARLLARPEFDRAACAGMRLFTSGSAPLLESIFEAFRARTGHAILERYGMTECGMSISNPLEGERRAGAVGLPLPEVDVRVVDDGGATLGPGAVGAIEFKGPNVFPGYWRMPEETVAAFTADGYFRSGDMGSISEDGYISIVGRSKDLVISGGLNVYPKEVELCIDQLAGVVESAVIGLPHPDFGEQVTAIVVPEPHVGEPNARSLIDALEPHLARFKIPKQIFFVDELPRNAMGKVQKSVLRERFASG